MTLTRTSIYGPQGHGGQPIPAACRVGGLVATGGVSGAAADGSLPPNVAAQSANMFANLRALLEAAGSSADLILKVTVYMPDRSAREALNNDWLAMFPDPASRPARHVIVYQDLPPGMLLQCDALAVVAPVAAEDGQWTT